MTEKPIKSETSSSGGKISYFAWGLRHTARKRYSGGTDDRDEEQSSKETDQKE